MTSGGLQFKPVIGRLTFCSIHLDVSSLMLVASAALRKAKGRLRTGLCPGLNLGLACAEIQEHWQH